MSSAFAKGVQSFKAGNLDNALQFFTEAIQAGFEDPNVYDSRAAVYEKLGKRREALLDCRKEIELGSTRWQGYLRSARLFLDIGKPDRAEYMLDMAQKRIRSQDKKRTDEVASLRKSLKEQRSRTFYHFGKIPFEIALMIFTFASEGQSHKIIPLTQVCKDWRATLFNAPSLWRDLVLTHRHPAKKARVWSERCQGIIEELTLRGNMLSALEALRQYNFTRLRSLTLDNVDPSQLLEELPNLTLRIIYKLCVIDIQFPGTMNMNIDWIWAGSDRNSENHAPHSISPISLPSTETPNHNTEADKLVTPLQHLNLAVSHGSWEALAKNLNNLRSFTYPRSLRSVDFPYLRSLLHRNPELRYLDLLVNVQGPASEANAVEGLDLPDALLLLHLEDLSITAGPHWSERLLVWLHLPKLRKLKFVTLHMEPVLHHFLHHKFGQNLIELRLESCILQIDMLIKLLELSINLERLSITVVTDPNIYSLLDALAGQPIEETDSDGAPQRKYLCPALRGLNLSGSTVLSEGPIVRLIKHRNVEPDIAQTGRQVSKIESLIIDKCPKIDPAVLPWLREKVPRVSCVYMTKEEARRSKR